MCRAGKHRELRTWQAGEIARHPAAEQAKQLDRVLGADNIRIPNDEQGGRLDRTNGLYWPVLDLVVQLLLLGEESGKILRMRCDAGSAFRVGIFSAKREREVPSEKELSLCRTRPFDLLYAIAFSVGRTKPRPQMDAFSC